MGTKPEMMSDEEKVVRDDSREGLADLDQMLERQTRRRLAQAGSPEERAEIIAQHDAERNLPRRRVPSSATKRKNPPEGSRRALTANRQKESSTDKNKAGAKMPMTHRRALADVLTTPASLTAINDQLARVNGDIHELDDGTQTKIRRVEQAIGQMEATNRGDHTVYVTAEFPQGVNRSNWEGFVNNQFPDDSAAAFDRFNTGSLHAWRAVDPEATWRPVHQFRTARAGYVGKSGKGGQAHAEGGVIMQRGVRYRKVAVQKNQPIALPNGSTTKRDVIVWEEATD